MARKRSLPTQRNRSVRIGIGVLALSVAAGGASVWMYKRGGTEKTSPRGGAPVLLDAAGRGTTPGLSLADAVSSVLFPEGTEQTYAVVQSSLMSTSSQTLYEIALRGTLRVDGLRIYPTVLVRAQFSGETEIRAASGDAGRPAEAKITEAIQRPFFLEFDSDGAFRRGLGDAAAPSFVAQLWTSFGGYLQLVRARDKDLWRVRERDKAGEYVAEYQRRAGGEVVKRKLRYDKLVAKGLASFDVLSSRTLFRLDSAFALEGVDLLEETRAEPVATQMPAFGATAKMTLTRQGAPVRVDDRISTWLADAARAVPFDRIQEEQGQRAMDEARIGNLTLASAYAQMRAFVATDAGSADKDRAGRAFVGFAALLRQNPDNLAFVRSELAKKGRMTTTLLAALRDASTPESLALLADMATASKSPLGADDREEAARALSLASAPTAASIHALETLRSDPDLWGQATYGVGSALHRVLDSDPGLAADARQALTQQLSSAPDDGTRATVLTALGNAGDPMTLDDIRKYVSDPSATVRAGAAQALRRIPGADADQLVAQLCGDPVPEVRFAAADAASERSATPVLAQALAGVALHDDTYQARAKAVDTLADWLPSLPAIAQTLRIVAAGDTNADLRNVAKNALQRAG